MSGPAETLTLSARWVFPASSPPLERGTVTVRGDRIDAVEPHGTRTPDVDLGNAAITPGLVNAHTHLDLTGARGCTPPTDPDHFTDWLKSVIAYRRSRTPEETRSDIREGLAECLRSGTTLVGDIAVEGQSWDTLANAAVRAVVFREMIGLKGERQMQVWKELSSWINTHPSTPTCRWAVSPHAPYSVYAPLIRSAAWNGYTLTIHLAESPGEMELFTSRTGPFVSFLESVNGWEPDGLASSFDWILWRTARSQHVLFAHCNYLPPDAGLRPNQSIVYCPRTHAAFGHPPHPFRDFLDRGVRVCIGTDSLASNPDLDILAEARFVHERYPDFPGDVLLKMVTLSGAEALGWADEAGSLEPGKSADLVVVPLPDRDGDPPELLFAADAPTSDRRTMFRGEWR